LEVIALFRTEGPYRDPGARADLLRHIERELLADGEPIALRSA
jgi:hypothetical protein